MGFQNIYYLKRVERMRKSRNLFGVQQSGVREVRADGGRYREVPLLLLVVELANFVEMLLHHRVHEHLVRRVVAQHFIKHSDGLD